MTTEELIEKYVSDHADCRWMDACDLDDLLHAFVKELSPLNLPSNLDEAAKEFLKNYIPFDQIDSRDIIQLFKAGAEWMANEFENNRLKDCEALSEEDYKLESDFVDAHIKKNHRLPTFLDAIKYGAEWMAKQGETIFDTIDVDGGERWLSENLLQGDYDCGEEVIVQVRKK